MEARFSKFIRLLVIFLFVEFSWEFKNGEYGNHSLYNFILDSGDYDNGFVYNNNVNISTITKLVGYINDSSIFLFVFKKNSDREDGRIFIFPRSAFNSLNKANSNKIEQSVETITGFLFNPYINSYLTLKYLIDFEVIPESPVQDWYFPRSIKTSTEQNPYGLILNPMRPIPNNDFFNKRTLLKRGFLNSIMYVNPNSNYTIPNVYIPIYESAWPLKISMFESTLIQSDSFRVNITIGKEFMGMSITSSEYLPLEMIVTPHDSVLKMITRYKPSIILDPPGPSEGPVYKVFILGYGTTKTDSLMYKTMQTIASYPEESLDYRYQLSMANFETCFLLTYDKKYLVNEVLMEYFQKIFSRISTAIFSLSEMVRLSKYVIYNEIIDMDFNVKIITNILVNYKLFKISENVNIHSPQPNVLIDSSRKNIVNIIKMEKYSSMPNSKDSNVTYLKAVYTYLNSSTQKSLDISYDIVNKLYNESLYELVDWNITSRQSLFLATSLLLIKAKNDINKLNYGDIANIRKVVLQCTSMCTSKHATSIEWGLEDIFNAKENFKNQFNIIDIFSPCMASTRYDLIETLQVVNLFSVIPENVNFEKMLSMGSKVASVTNSHIVSGSDKIRMLIPELSSCNINMDIPMLAILPVTSNNSYVLTRKSLNRGMVYNVNGIDITNPIFISYINSSNCKSSNGEITSVDLINPKNSKDCLYCGSVIMHYLSSGVIVDFLYINDKGIEVQLSTGINSTIPSFNPLSYSVNTKTLLFFPNGTIATIKSFTSQEIILFSNTFIIISIVGVLIASIVVYGIFKMLCSFSSNVKYSLLTNKY
ncbi:envelope glycoprotein H-like protein [Phocid alphaherpesvirus 1]|uniref:Envelope glycoprotein H-like protein n=1 Tax=Phocid alphaherpesvirus 1 TaxID=47418 RepID=A0A482F750_9ALPH|nr:envelope glycoprotein H-like protein [Phocid alphaherpesvirus 1]QBN85141.1 envelope glycoprotein H-like protein [Phocid alphaherpesvirus 1]